MRGSSTIVFIVAGVALAAPPAGGGQNLARGGAESGHGTYKRTYKRNTLYARARVCVCARRQSDDEDVSHDPHSSLPLLLDVR